MKKIAFTVIFLFVLGAAGTLYLEQSNKRFLESLPKAPLTDEQPVSTANAPVITEDENIIRLTSMPSETIEKQTVSESEHAHPHTLDQTQAAVNFEDPIPEPSIDATGESSFEDGLQEDIDLLEEVEKRVTATETLTEIVYDPSNWVEGKPGEVGFGFFLSTEDAEAFFGANALLNPTPANLRALEFMRNLPPPPSEYTGQGTGEFIEYNGGKLYEPIWLWTAD
ncbi:MAG: hypothetical protein OXU27_18510 [Candidatus Poribacteria bacterium]|nr:hypothetical protein [Candidatus Poribacteria bacterium]